MANKTKDYTKNWGGKTKDDDYTTEGTPMSYYDQQIKALGAQRDSGVKTANEQYDAVMKMIKDMYGSNTGRLEEQYETDRGVLSGQYSRNAAALRQGADQQRQEASIIYDKMRKYLPQQAQQAGVAWTGYYGPESLRLRANSNLQKSLGEIEMQYGKNKATLDTANESALNELMRQYGRDRTSLDNEYSKSMAQNEIARSEALQKIVDSYNTGVEGYRAAEYEEQAIRDANASAEQEARYNQALEDVFKYYDNEDDALAYLDANVKGYVTDAQYQDLVAKVMSGVYGRAADAKRAEAQEAAYQNAVEQLYYFDSEKEATDFVNSLDVSDERRQDLMRIVDATFRGNYNDVLNGVVPTAAGNTFDHVADDAAIESKEFTKALKTRFGTDDPNSARFKDGDTFNVGNITYEYIGGVWCVVNVPRTETADTETQGTTEDEQKPGTISYNGRNYVYMGISPNQPNDLSWAYPYAKDGAVIADGGKLFVLRNGKWEVYGPEKEK